MPSRVRRKGDSMPRIKAYRGAGKIIPVSEARVTTAFRCPWTGKLFSSKKDYLSHLRILRRDRIHAAIRRGITQRQHEDLWAQKSFDDIIAWIERNPDFFFDKACWHRGEGRQDRIAAYRDKFWIKITYLDLQWSDRISNSHSCPRGGVTNWGGRETYADGTTKPNGYPGWGGRIEFQLSHDLGFGSDVMRSTGIHTGTGGGIKHNRFGFDVRFFESDWPGLDELVVLGRLIEDRSWMRYKYGEPLYFR